MCTVFIIELKVVAPILLMLSIIENLPTFKSFHSPKVMFKYLSAQIVCKCSFPPTSHMAAILHLCTVHPKTYTDLSPEENEVHTMHMCTLPLRHNLACSYRM